MMLGAGKTIIGLIAIVIAASANAAQANDYPNRPITMVVGYSPGGIADINARVVAKALSDVLGKPVIVDNKPGASGIIAAESVASSKPDGYTIMMSAAGVFTAQEFLFKKLPYNPSKSFTLVHGLFSSPMILAVRADAPFKSVNDLVQYAKANPNKLNFSSVGNGTSQHIVTELFMKDSGAQMTHVPYKSSSQAITDLLSGTIEVMFDYHSTLGPQIEAGKVRAFGVTAAERLTNMSQLPTMVELGFPQTIGSQAGIIVGPAGIPKQTVEILEKAISQTLTDPTVVNTFNSQGSSIMRGVGATNLAKFLGEERERVSDAIKRAGLQPE